MGTKRRKPVEIGDEIGRASLFRIFGKQKLVGRSPNTPHDFRADVTPRMARGLMDLHETREASAGHMLNRHISQAGIEPYKRDLTSSRWSITHQGMAFGPSGVCVDGRHRLATIIAANTTMPQVLITLDAEVPSIINVDIGRRRLPHDGLICAGLSTDATRTMVSIAKFMENKGAGRHPVGQRRLTPLEVHERLQVHGDAIHFAMGAVRSRHVKYITTAPVISAIAKAYYYYSTPEERENLRRFVDVLITGRAEGRHQWAASNLAKQLTNMAGASKQGIERQDVHIRTQSAIRAFMCGEERSFYRRQRHEPFPLQ